MVDGVLLGEVDARARVLGQSRRVFVERALGVRLNEGTGVERFEPRVALRTAGQSEAVVDGRSRA